jgi:hypothetical protein
MQHHQHLRVVFVTQRNAAEIADPEVDGHPHTLDGSPEHNALAVQFNVAHAIVGADVVRIEAYGSRERVEPQDAARPGGIDPACCCLTPHGFYLPAGIMFPVDA